MAPAEYLPTCALDGAPQQRNHQPFAEQAVLQQSQAPTQRRLTARGLLRLFTSGEPFDTAHVRVIGRLLADAAEMNLDVIVCPWDDSRLRGLYIDSHHLIALNARMRPYQVLGTLGHEIVHAAYRDQRSTAWTEARADLLSAVTTIDLVGVRASRTDRSTKPKTFARSRNQNDLVFSAIGSRAEQLIDWGTS